MIGIHTDVIRPQVNKSALAYESARLADGIALTVTNNLKIALIERKKVATAKTLKSVAAERILDSASRGIFKRQVVGAKSFIFVEMGRKAGGKMPPLKELMPWFVALGIPKVAWFPILRKIARHGIKPTNIRNRAIKASRPAIAALAAQAGERLKEKLFSK